MMKITMRVMLIAASLFAATQAQAYNCGSLPQYVMGNSYNTGGIIKNLNNAYRCDVGGWCSLASDAYEPGRGWAQQYAWTHLGACDGNASSSVSVTSSRSSSISSSVLAKSSSSSFVSSRAPSSSSVVASSRSASSIASSTAGCNSPAYSAGTTYTLNQQVANKGRVYSCQIPGWCSSGAAWAYEPGVGTAWQSAWTDAGVCSGGSSSVKSSSSLAKSSSSSSSSLKSSSSSVSSIVASSSSKSSISSSSGSCTIDSLPGGSYSMCKSDLDAAEAAKTSSTLFAQVKASIQTRDNSIVDAINPQAASNPDNVKRVEGIISESSWNHMFPLANSAYNYTRFLRAIGKFKGFCATYTDGRNSNAICRRALATMFAHFTQETGAHAPNWAEEEWRQGLYFVREASCQETGPGCGYNSECSASGWQTDMWPCGKQANGEFVKYYGRGAKQLSYHYNYGPFSEAMFGDARVLLNNPDMVAESWLNVASAAFFFVYPQSPKPSMLHVIDGTWVPNATDIAAGIEPGFGATTNIINGGLECNKGAEGYQSVNRMNYYQKFSLYLNNPIVGEKLGCANMAAFSTAGAGALLIYWDQDWGYNPNRPEGKSFECKLVGYQTAYSALATGDYQECVAKHFNVTNIK